MPIADYSKSGAAVTINLAARTVSAFDPGLSGITREAPMLTGKLGWSTVPLLTVGETVANAYQPIGRLDGIGHLKINDTTVRLYINHEVSSDLGTIFTLENGTALHGSRISYFDIDITSKAIIAGGDAISAIHNRGGVLVDSKSDLESEGFTAFCSSVLVKQQEFGFNRGISDTVYFAGEEKTPGPGGTEWALDVATGELWAIPDFGRGKWENVAQVDTGDTTHVAFLLSDDTPGNAFYMYVGTKNPTGDFLGRNGLSGGQLYVWSADAGDLTAGTFQSGTRSGTWIPLATRNAGLANTAGYDELGYKTATKLAADADALGAFSFARSEDISRDPLNNSSFVFAATGRDNFDNGANTAGIVYQVSVDLSTLSAPKATFSILHNANTAPGQPIRSPDNVEWSADGWIYVQEDQAADIFGPGSPNTTEASVLRINPTTGAIERIATINRGAVGVNFTDENAGTNGSWETTGLIDVSVAFGKSPGTLFLTNVMAHGLNDERLVEGGQLLLLSSPGGDNVPGVKVTSIAATKFAIGSNFADYLVGNTAANTLDGNAGNDRLYGGPGADKIYGGDGRDKLIGGNGHDTLSGGAGADRYIWKSAKHGGDTITYFSETDTFVFKGSAFGLGAVSGSLAGKHFRAGPTKQALDSTDYFIFRTTDDTLWFDADGNGSQIPVLIADLVNDAHVTHGDILIT
jgi:Ca2+-binding RTX toxin-like protein